MSLDRERALAKSAVWSDRVEAARLLSKHETEVVRDELSVLLSDEDLAVVFETATDMMRLASAPAFTLVMQALGQADRQADFQRSDTILDSVPPVWRGDEVPIPDLARDVLKMSKADSDAHRGAKILLQWLRDK
jgi:hypothetical protein